MCWTPLLMIPSGRECLRLPPLSMYSCVLLMLWQPQKIAYWHYA